MRAKATSALAVKNAKPESKPYKMGAGKAMYLLVNPNGSKLWRLKYRINSKEKTLSFGAYPEVSLADARALRDNARKQLAEGLDPSTAKKEERKEQQAKALTFKTVAERWFKGHTELAQKTWSPANAKKVRLYLENDMYPTLGDKPIADITRPELNALNESIEKRGSFDVAKHVRQWLNAIFIEAWDNDEVPFNPAQGLKPSHYGIGVKSKHYPFIPLAELPELLEKVNASGRHKVIKLAIRFLILTVVRTGELRFSTWEEFNLDTATWSIPAERMKMRRPHNVPLPSQALAILEELKELNGEKLYPFAISHKPISEASINTLLKSIGYKGRQTGHGFRHLISTNLNEMGYNGDWVEKQLAHEGKDKIRSTYNHAEYLEERRQMMQEWADIVEPC